MPKHLRFAALATLAALLAIVLGALVCFAPLRQPGRVLHTESLPDPADIESPAAAPVNVNMADAETLTKLPGIGDAKAQAILAYRAEHGPFAALAELENVSGISARMVESWQGLATTGENEKEA